MGIGAIDYAINGDVKPARVVVVDIDEQRLARAEQLLPVAMAAEKGVELVYINSKTLSDPASHLQGTDGSGHGFDDVFVYAAVAQVISWAMPCWQKTVV